MKVAPLVLVGLVACTMAERPPPMPGVETEIVAVEVSDAFDVEETKGISAAFDEWNDVLNGYIRFTVVTPDQALWADDKIEVRRTPDNVWRPELLAWVDTLGGRVIHLYPARIHKTEYLLQDITRHEIGHVLGVPDDTRNLHTLMATPVSAMTLCIDKRTTDEVARLHRFDAWHMYPECP